MKSLVKLASIPLILSALSACTASDFRAIAGSAIADGADTQVKYSRGDCATLRQRCVQGDFQEWETSDKQMGCSCKKL